MNREAAHAVVAVPHSAGPGVVVPATLGNCGLCSQLVSGRQALEVLRSWETARDVDTALLQHLRQGHPDSRAE
ncbi:hypothetical protein CTZ27_12305 [Streptomyces griseocarneus]|nr:hypothetical protein CTZ27_12305 [Streptomyces griseocarneus]